MVRIVDVIQSRRSVRTFENRPLTPDDRAYVEQIIRSIETPFGAPVEFRLLDAAAHGLRSPVIVGAHEYVAAKVERVQELSSLWASPSRHSVSARQSEELAPSCSRHRSLASRLRKPWRSAQAKSCP